MESSCKPGDLVDSQPPGDTIIFPEPPFEVEAPGSYYGNQFLWRLICVDGEPTWVSSPYT